MPRSAAATKAAGSSGRATPALSPRLRSVLRAAALVALSLAPAAPADGAISGPKGVRVEQVARGLGHPTNIAFDPSGGIWTTSADYGLFASDGVWWVKRRGASARHVVRGLNSAL